MLRRELSRQNIIYRQRRRRGRLFWWRLRCAAVYLGLSECASGVDFPFFPDDDDADADTGGVVTDDDEFYKWPTGAHFSRGHGRRQ